MYKCLHTTLCVIYLTYTACGKMTENNAPTIIILFNEKKDSYQQQHSWSSHKRIHNASLFSLMPSNIHIYSSNAYMNITAEK